MRRGTTLIALSLLIGLGAVALRAAVLKDGAAQEEAGADPAAAPDDAPVDDPATAVRNLSRHVVGWWAQAANALAGDEDGDGYLEPDEETAAEDAPADEQAAAFVRPEPLSLPSEASAFGFFLTDDAGIRRAAQGLPEDPVGAGAQLYSTLAHPGQSLAYTLRFEEHDPGPPVSAVLAAAGYEAALLHAADGPRRLDPEEAAAHLARLDEALRALGGAAGVARRAAVWRVGLLDPERVASLGGLPPPGEPLGPGLESLADAEGFAAEEQLVLFLRRALDEARRDDRVLIQVKVEG